MTSGLRLLVARPGSPPAWRTVGDRDEAGVDLPTDLAVDGLPLPAGSVHAAASSLLLHRYLPYEALGILGELRRVLVAGAVLRLSLLDLDAALEVYRAGGGDLWGHAWRSTGGNLVTQLLGNGAFRTPYTAPFAAELLELAGFADVRAVGAGPPATGVPRISADEPAEEGLFHLEAAAPGLPPPPDLAPRLCWTADPRTSASVVWRTGNPDGGRVEADRGEGWCLVRPVSAPGRWGGFVHTATAADLRPDQAVRWRVAGEALEACAAPADPEARFRFSFLCDTGIAGRRDGLANGVEPVLDAVMAVRPLFVLGGGDYAYADSDARFPVAGAAVDAWVQQVRPLAARCPMVLQFGNHEVSLGERWLDYAELFPGPAPALGGRCGSFDAGAAHFAGVFAPEDGVDVEVVQWLEDDLAAARSRGARWLVVWQHGPLLASGTAHPASPRLRRQLGPTLERHGVDLHLSGHDQCYERTFPLRGLAGSPTVTSTATDRYPAKAGVICAKVSPGGKHSSRGGGSLLLEPQIEFTACRNDRAHHVAVATVDGQARLEVEVLAVRPGWVPRVIDRFVIEAARRS